MKILILVRENFYEIFGGDTVQLLKTKEYLENVFNVQIEIITNEDKIFESTDFDILHVFNINTRKNLDLFIKQVKDKNKKVILSPIYWDFSHSFYVSSLSSYLNIQKCSKYICYFKNIYLKFIDFITLMNKQYRNKRYIIPETKEFKKRHKNLINLADIIIPNSDEEGKILCKNIGLGYEKVKDKFISVPNAVDISFLKQNFTSNILPEINDFVLEAARIEPLKNQINLLLALYDEKQIPIVFAGEAINKNYYSKLKKLADKRGNVYFTGKISQEEIFSLYKRAKIHVLPSFRESPGLSTIEALMNGCQVVVSEEKFCPLKYYKFDKYGFICDPYDTKSIRDAILNAYNNPKDITLPKEYYEFFSYNNVADMTYQAYKKLFEKE